MALLFVLGWGWASTSVAEAAVQPRGEVTFLTRRQWHRNGRLAEFSSYKMVALGAEANVGGGLAFYGRIGFGSSPELTVGDTPVGVKRNTYSLVNVGLKYTMRHGDGFHFGPAFDYAHVSTTLERGSTAVTNVITGPGLGGYVTSTLDDLNVTISYVYRLQAHSSIHTGGVLGDPASVSGNTVELRTTYPLSERHTLTAGYVLNTEAIYKEGLDRGRRVISSGFRIGVNVEL